MVFVIRITLPAFFIILLCSILPHNIYANAKPLIVAQSQTEATGNNTGSAPSEAKQQVKEGTEAILVTSGGLLIPKGMMVIEPSFNYSHYSRNLISINGFTLFGAIVVGTIQVEDIKRDILSGSVTFRYGLLNNLQVEAKLPYLYRNDRLVTPAGSGTSSNTGSVRETNDDGFGDVELGLSYHAFQSKGWKPDILFNVRAKTKTGRDPYELSTETVDGQKLATELPTGTGHYGLSGGFSLVKSSDPVVFFGGGSYFWNFDRTVGGEFGKVEPGDSIELNLGMALALNEKLSLNLYFQDIFTDETIQNSVEIPNSKLNVANFFAGISYSINKSTSIITNVGFGLTEDSGDFQIQVNVPISFDF